MILKFSVFFYAFSVVLAMNLILLRCQIEFKIKFTLLHFIHSNFHPWHCHCYGLFGSHRRHTRHELQLIYNFHFSPLALHPLSLFSFFFSLVAQFSRFAIGIQIAPPLTHIYMQFIHRPLIVIPPHFF